MVQYTDDLNKRMNKVVRAFNAKRRYNKTKTRRKGMIPSKLSFAKLRDKYSDKPKAELEKQLRLYESFGKRSSLNKLSPNSRISEWEYNYFKANEAKTREFYRNEIADLERIIGDKPEYHLKMHDRLTNLKRRQEKLDLDFTTLDEDQIKMMRSIYNYAERSELVKQQGFRLYLSQLDRTMRNLGYSKSERESLINKFNTLSENEFTEMVRNEDIIDRVYEIVDSPKGRGEYELMIDESNAKEIVTLIQEQADNLIAKYKITSQ